MRFSLMSSKLLPSQKQLKTIVLSSKEVRRIFGNPHERKFAELYETQRSIRLKFVRLTILDWEVKPT